MGDISTWNPVDNSNTTAPPDGWPEYMAPSAVNNSARAMMGAVRRWYDTVTTQIAGMLPLTGGTITGPLAVTGAITGNTTLLINGAGDGAIYVPNGGISIGGNITSPGGSISIAGAAHVGGQITADVLYITGGGDGVIYAPSGGISIGGNITSSSGSITVAGAAHVGGQITGDVLYITGTGVGAIYAPNGGITVGGNGFKPGGGMWVDSSDIRTKRDIEVYPAGLTEIALLRPVKYFQNGRGETEDNGRQFVGLVADEVRPVMPEMVGTVQRLLDPGDQQASDVLTLDATPLIYALVNSCQELAAQNAALATRITALEGNHA